MIETTYHVQMRGGRPRYFPLLWSAEEGRYVIPEDVIDGTGFATAGEAHADALRRKARSNRGRLTRRGRSRMRRNSSSSGKWLSYSSTDPAWAVDKSPNKSGSFRLTGTGSDLVAVVPVTIHGYVHYLPSVHVAGHWLTMERAYTTLPVAKREASEAYLVQRKYVDRVSVQEGARQNGARVRLPVAITLAETDKARLRETQLGFEVWDKQVGPLWADGAVMLYQDLEEAKRAFAKLKRR